MNSWLSIALRGQVVVARDVCPHRGVPLTLGFQDGEGIVCPYHGLRFGEDGLCQPHSLKPRSSGAGEA